MTDRARQIGFSSQRIRLAWMDRAACLAREAVSTSAVKEALLAHLGLDLAGDVKGKRGSREKALTVLMRTWVTPTPALESLRDDCLEIVGNTPDSRTRVAIHWAMIGAVYPFWRAVAASAGRLLRLQDSFTASQIRRRLSETYGDRELVARATRTVLRSFIDWAALDGRTQKGLYFAAEPIELDDPRLAALLAESLLYSGRSTTIGRQDFLTHPALFPFYVGGIASRALVAASSRLELYDTGSGEVIGLVVGSSGEENSAL